MTDEARGEGVAIEEGRGHGLELSVVRGQLTVQQEVADVVVLPVHRIVARVRASVAPMATANDDLIMVASLLLYRQCAHVQNTDTDRTDRAQRQFQGQTV